MMAPGALDPLTKEMVYLAVSITQWCVYCIASHGAARKAPRDEQGDAGRADRDCRHGQPDQSAGRRVSRSGGREVRESVLIKADASRDRLAAHKRLSFGYRDRT